MKVLWFTLSLLALLLSVQTILANPVSFPSEVAPASSSDSRSLHDPQPAVAEPRIIHRQIRRLLLNCLLGRRRRSIDQTPQARFFFPVVQYTNVHVSDGGHGSYGGSSGGGGHPNLCSSLGGLNPLGSAPALLPSTSENNGDDSEDTTDNNSIIPVTEENNERIRRPQYYNFNRYLRPIYRNVVRFTRLF